MIDLKQRELAKWQKKNFPMPNLSPKEQLMLQCALGVAEESGELAHHVLKGSQHIRGGEFGFDQDEIADAVADILVYSMQLLTCLGVDAEYMIDKTINEVLERDWHADPSGESFKGKGPVQNGG